MPKRRGDIAKRVFEKQEMRRKHRAKFYIVSEHDVDPDTEWLSVGKNVENDFLPSTESNSTFCSNAKILVDYDPGE